MSTSKPADGLIHERVDAEHRGFRARYLNPPELWAAPRITQVVDVREARMIYLSGQTPTTADYRVVTGGFREQLHRVFDNIETALAAVGAGLADIVKTTTYITDPAHREAMREVRVARMGHLPAYPANTALVVARLIEPEFLVEVDVVAAVPAGRG